MEMKLQLIFTLSTLISITGSSDVLRVVGDSVQLDSSGSVSEFDYYFWVLNRTINVLKYNKKHKDIMPNLRYKDRVEFKEETCSLILKNLQKTDSGLYEVKASSAEHTSAAVYQLSVLDPVEAPVLSYNESTDTCNITVTCRGHNLSVTSSCSYRTCEEKEVASPGGIALSLSIQNSTIICNHSNPVNWKQEALEMKTFGHLCSDEDAVSPPAGGSVCLLKTGLYSIILIIMLSAVITVHVRERRNKPS